MKEAQTINLLTAGTRAQRRRALREAKSKIFANTTTTAAQKRDAMRQLWKHAQTQRGAE
jgi:hypothetical protein